MKCKMLALCAAALCSSVLPGCVRQKKASAAESLSFQLPDGMETSGIYVKPVPGISSDFIRGMDASSVLAEENSGVAYYNFKGEKQDVFMTLAQSGVNYIRLRVWNDPYDENGNGYGGGNNDVAAAVELGKRATKYGMKVCIDFHYSDFWADPKRQHAPKAWKNMDIRKKCDALYAFTKKSLKTILDAGVNVGMVQIGNEINFGMSGETDRAAVTSLLKSGSRAVREISKKYRQDMQIAVHYTRINQPDNLYQLVENVSRENVDYDCIGLSYYPFWDGTIDNMKTVVKTIRETYKKPVFIAETSYCYTAEDGDGFGNSLAGKADLVEGYAATVQGQADMIRDVAAAASEAGAFGFFYWEGVWIPVGKSREANSVLWEKFGSGWASSYSAGYDPDDAGLYYGGSSWDNQAFFDFDGHPLASLDVFKYLQHGSTAPLAIDFISDVHISCNAGEKIVLPETVSVRYNDGSEKQMKASWNREQIAAINSAQEGTYSVEGTVEGRAVSCQIDVLLINYVKNPGFEDDDVSMWNVSYAGNTNPTDFQKKENDAHTGTTAFHFYSDSDMEFSIEQTLTDLKPGTYRLSAYAQGGDMAEDSVLELYAVSGGTEKSVPFMVTTWVDWKHPVVSGIKVSDGTLAVGVRMKCNAKSWGTIDDFIVNRISD